MYQGASVSSRRRVEGLGLIFDHEQYIGGLHRAASKRGHSPGCDQGGCITDIARAASERAGWVRVRQGIEGFGDIQGRFQAYLGRMVPSERKPEAVWCSKTEAAV